MKFEFTIESYVLISTNEMYMPRPAKGGRSAYIIKTNNLRKFEDEIDRKLLELIPDDVVESLLSELEDDQIVLNLSIDIGMSKTDFFRVDSSNYLKPLEDAIKFRIRTDDTRNVTVSATKHIIETDDSNSWDTKVVLETYKPSFDIPNDQWVKEIKE